MQRRLTICGLGPLEQCLTWLSIHRTQQPEPRVRNLGRRGVRPIADLELARQSVMAVLGLCPGSHNTWSNCQALRTEAGGIAGGQSCCPIPHMAPYPLPQAQPPQGSSRGTGAFSRPTHLRRWSSPH